MLLIFKWSTEQQHRCKIKVFFPLLHIKTDLVQWDNRKQTFPSNRDRDRTSPSAQYCQRCLSSSYTCCKERSILHICRQRICHNYHYRTHCSSEWSLCDSFTCFHKIKKESYQINLTKWEKYDFWSEIFWQKICFSYDELPNTSLFSVIWCLDVLKMLLYVF